MYPGCNAVQTSLIALSCLQLHSELTTGIVSPHVAHTSETKNDFEAHEI